MGLGRSFPTIFQYFRPFRHCHLNKMVVLIIFRRFPEYCQKVMQTFLSICRKCTNFKFHPSNTRSFQITQKGNGIQHSVLMHINTTGSGIMVAQWFCAPELSSGLFVQFESSEVFGDNFKMPSSFTRLLL